jgi:hypothetical protein
MIPNNMRRAQAAAGGSVTISPTPNWTDINTSLTVTNWQQATGIGSTVTLSATVAAGGSVGAKGIAYVNTSASTTGATVTNLPRSATTNFTVAPNNYVAFAFDDVGAGYTGSMTIRNVTDGNALLDTINVLTSP